MQQKQCLKQRKSILTKCSNKELLKALKPPISNNLLEKDLMKKSMNLVTQTSGSTLNMMPKEQANSIGFTISLVVTLILTFLLYVPRTIPKRMKEKILKIFGNEKM